MSKTNGAVYTIGYEGISAARLIELLEENGIEMLIDARYRPASRKPGLSKTSLASACARAGIEYTHDRGLGTPPEIMRRLREEGIYDWDAYRAHLHEQEDALAQASGLAHSHRVCFLCYEADAMTCHRRFVADEIAGRVKKAVEHIPVTPA